MTSPAPGGTLQAVSAPPSEPRFGSALRSWALPVLTVAGMVVVLGLAERTVGGDGAHLAGSELRLAQLLGDGEIVRAFGLFSTLIAPHPPAGYVPGVVAALLFGANVWTPLLAMAVPLLLTWDALRRLGDGRLPWAGWLAVCASPLTWLYVEQHGRDLVGAAALAQAISWLYASKGLADRRAAAWFGGWLAVAFLTKYTCPMFAVLPCLAVVPSLRSRERWAALGGAVLVFLVIAGPWYLSYFDRVLAYVVPSETAMVTSQAMSRREQGRLTPEVLALYPLAMKDALGWPGVGMVLAGAALGRRASVLPLAAALGGMAVLTPLGQAQDRYALPAFVFLAALVAPLARSRLGAVAVLVVFGAQFVATVGTFRPGAPAARTGSFDHPLTTATALSWPKSIAYGPVDFDLAAWRIDEAITGLREAHGRPEGTVGLLLPREPDMPDFGVFLARSTALGNRWDFANVNLRARHGGLPDPYFMGPMRAGDWPPSRFSAMYAIVPRQPDGDITEWLAAHRLTEVARFELPRGATGIVYQVEP